jgi:NAD(P)-dependent dehydrogenase (short-subunit alcohol dehydrogenase family)
MGVLETFSLAGCIAMVTGGGRGIGRSLAGALAEAGADVAIVDVDSETAGSAADEIGRMGVRSLGIEADVTRSTQVQATVDTVVSNWGHLDIAVNNAGIARTGQAESLEEADWDAVLDVNLKSVFLCCRAEAQVMLGQGSGSIINIASMSARIVNRPQQHAHYNSSKAAVVQLTRTCAAEWAARGVRVNSISPGHMLTPMTDAMSDEAKTTWISNTPMGRAGIPDDLQGAVVFLASAASQYVTGHDLVVDGGYTIW